MFIIKHYMLYKVLKNVNFCVCKLLTGIIGPSRTSTATRVASLMRDMQVPIVSFAATRAELSNMTEYPTFLRTVPSDVHQMAVSQCNFTICDSFKSAYISIVT